MGFSFNIWMLLIPVALWALKKVVFTGNRKDFRNKVVLITGGAGALGEELARDFLRRGSKVALWDLRGSEQAAEKLAREVPGSVVRGYNVDVTDRKQVYSVADRVRADLGRVAVLVNNAGILPGKDPFWKTKDEIIERTMSVNSLAHFWMSKAVLPGMIDRKEGTIISVASSAGFFFSPRMVAYSASKAAAAHFAETLAWELRWLNLDKYISVTCVCPYAIDTPLITGWKEMSMMRTLTAKEVALTAVEEASKGTPLVFIPGSLWLSLCTKYFFPTWLGHWLFKKVGLYEVTSAISGRSEAEMLGKKED